jgi:L-aspartate oxidase
MDLKFDFLVIGSGAAGLTYALKVAEKGSVGIITKAEAYESNTSWAQGGVAAVWDTDDDFENHIEDTLIAGANLCKKEAVEMIVREGPAMIKQLIDFGAKFTQDKEGKLHLGREGGHGKNRIVHAADMTGKEIERVLLAAATAHPNIQILNHHFALELITEHHIGSYITRYDDVTCFGAYVLDVKTEKVIKVLSKATVLATGGSGQVYLHTTNPSVATGDGVAMAYRAKARIGNMEFIQFHPTSLCLPGANSFLISEAVRGHGGILRNQNMEAFMHQYDERKELAPRDIVARAIDHQLKKSGDEFVYLDVTHLPNSEVKEHFPGIYQACYDLGLDITSEPIPVTPATHYMCGGVVTDLTGQTSIRHLFACGEVACTGVHGANRLASNSLLEAMVFADRAAQKSARHIHENPIRTDIPEWDESKTRKMDEWVFVRHDRRELQQVMSDYVGIVRSTMRLERARRRVKLLHEEVESFYQRTKVSVELCQLRNLVAVGSLIIRSAMSRHESRGLHYTTDYPKSSDQWLQDTII